ncbi:HyaD/HybD family hydrogenase maturation endopeptidase [Poseidonibacter sp. 1_MG-2023]|uniref:HyaD/HybD family hydrogenase maturation endopeptidase n=1 Tax=Poseidonibacter TaxID=2321187 RepID=UPI001E3CCF2C|nr:MULTISPECIES: HyaD/HybD family hydrogenase maturation endopeptidase [Poseidonibacter]MDO6827234.1 HyaD/HybD family hydrogenase maturation endopeptidase [Poseidonibacter sp. 1_MG-2023]
MEYERIALIGIGNIMFHDEGLGAYLVKYIEENYEDHPKLTIVEGGTLGFTLMTYYQEYDKVIIVGTGSKEGPVGTISSENSEQVMANDSDTRKTANEVEITMMIEICSFHEQMGEVQLITMVPHDIIDVKNAMTPEALEHMPALVEETLYELKNSGIELKRKKSAEVSFVSIIEDYANPKIADFTDMSKLI